MKIIHSLIKIRYLLLTAFVVLFSITLSYAQMTISGINEAEFIYRDAPDSLSNFFHNEASLKFNYRNIDFGMTFIADLPKHSNFADVKDLHPRMIDYRWERFYVMANLPNLTFRAGSFNEFFGNGVILRSYRDKAFEWDTTLNGLSTRFYSDYANIKAFYAALTSAEEDRYYDTAGGIDISSSYIDNYNFGISLLTTEELYSADYRNRIVAGGRLGIYFDKYDLMGEYSESRLYNNDDTTTNGQAIYLFGNKFFGPLTLSAGYKKYRNFNYQLNDLPTLNASEEPLSERYDPGTDEEGLLGQIQYNPSLNTSVSATYSEAWNKNYELRQSDLFIEASRVFEGFTLGVEFAKLETLDKERKEWMDEIKPAVYVDFAVEDISNHVRTQFKVETAVKDQDKETYYSPQLQWDVLFSKYSVSVTTETKLQTFDDLTDDPPLWVGLEVTAQVLPHTEIKAFVGEEKGGKVCRSGQCFYTSPFKGVKLNITTRF